MGETRARPETSTRTATSHGAGVHVRRPNAFIESPQWKRGALFIVYDEWGGFFDHVPPPRVPDIRNSTT